MGTITDKTIRDIKFEKGGTFSTKFILYFDREWNEVTKMFRNRCKDIEIVH